MRYIFSVGITMVFLAACNLKSTNRTVAPLTPVVADVTAQASPSVSIAANETQSLSSTGTSIAQIDATLHPVVTPVLRTPTPLALHYDLPQWLADPEANILLAVTFDDRANENYLTFVDATHNQRFDILAPRHTWEADWGYDTHGWYFEYPRKKVLGDTIVVDYYERVHLSVGEVQRIPEAETGQDVASEVRSGDYVARVIRDESGVKVMLDNESTDESVVLTDPFDGHYADYASVAWSTTRDLLAVTRYSGRKEPFHLPSSGLAIYTLDGRVYRWYGDIRGPSWAPDNTHRFLYAQGEDYGARWPCILDISLGSDICVESVLNWRDSHDVQTDMFEWVPNGRQISFVYWGSRTGGMCVADIDTDIVTCPFSKANLGQDRFIVNYGWAPDGRNVWLTVDSGSPDSDDRSFAQIATAGQNGEGLTLWGFGGTTSQEWRPELLP